MTQKRQNMTKNDKQWHKNDKQWRKMTQNDKNDTKWQTMTKNWHTMTKHDTKWQNMTNKWQKMTKKDKKKRKNDKQRHPYWHAFSHQQRLHGVTGYTVSFPPAMRWWSIAPPIVICFARGRGAVAFAHFPRHLRTFSHCRVHVLKNKWQKHVKNCQKMTKTQHKE